MFKVWILTIILGAGYGDTRTNEVVNYNFTTQKECLVASEYYIKQFTNVKTVRSVKTICFIGYVK